MKLEILYDWQQDCQPGFVRVYGRKQTGTDGNLEQDNRIPLPDECAEFIMAGSYLPYTDDLIAAFSELYRLCLDRAVLCLFVPYAHHYRHRTNPYMKQKFDEYTPRYLTSDFFQPPDSPVCPPLVGGEAPPPPFDYRLLQMRLMYTSLLSPDLYDEEERQALKDLQWNAVEYVYYTLVAIKSPIGPEELLQLSRQSYPKPLRMERMEQLYARGDSEGFDGQLNRFFGEDFL